MNYEVVEKKIRQQERRLFFKRWLKAPFQMGTLAPITAKLAASAAAALPQRDDGYIVEIGAGTGRLTRALLAAGVRPDHLWVVEIDPTLCDFLQATLPLLPACKSSPPVVIEGDARRLSELLPTEIVGKVASVVSAIPLMYLPQHMRVQIVDACFQVMRPGGEILQVTYSPSSPLASVYTLQQRRVVSHWLNLPSGFVWQYREKAA